MIPQKFLMMKCIRILLFLHVVGILFFVYKIYSIYTTRPDPPWVSSRNAVSWKITSNYSNPTQNKPAINSQKFSKKFNEVVDDVENHMKKSNYRQNENEDENNNEPDFEDKDNESKPPRYEDDSDPEYEDEIDDENQEETTDVEEYDEDYEDETEKTEDVHRSNSVANAKNDNPNVIFKGQQGEQVAVPAAILKNSHWTFTNAGKYSKSLYSPPPNETPRQRIPTAMVIGSPNSGIRPLLDFLEIHPQIVPVKKEIPIFDQQNKLQFFENSFISQMPLSYSNQVTVGRTHFSHWTKKSVCELYLRTKSMRIIIVLRDPVSRILSQATAKNVGASGKLVVHQLGNTLRVNNDTDPVDWGRYVEYVKMWLQCFPKYLIHIVEWSDIMQKPGLTVHKIEGFLGVPYRLKDENYHRDEIKRVYCIRPLHVKGTVCLSEKKGKSPTLTPQEEALIYRFYSKHNEELFKLLGQRYEWGPAGYSSRSQL